MAAAERSLVAYETKYGARVEHGEPFCSSPWFWIPVREPVDDLESKGLGGLGGRGGRSHRVEVALLGATWWLVPAVSNCLELRSSCEVGLSRPTSPDLVRDRSCDELSSWVEPSTTDCCGSELEEPSDSPSSMLLSPTESNASILRGHCFVIFEVQ